MRPDWDSYFMILAKVAASRSTCNSRPTGCVLVKDNQVLATGYNGPPPKMLHCSEIGGDNYCLRRDKGASNTNKQDVCIASHCEMNAIAMAAKKGISIVESTLYVTLNPCFICLKALRVAGVEKIYYELLYDLNPQENFNEMVLSMGFLECKELRVSCDDLLHVTGTLTYPTSVRRKPATEN